MTVGLTNDPWPDATTTQESRFPSTTLICHATHKRASNSKLKGSEFLENFWFLNIQLSVMIVNGSTLLQFGLHDSLYQIKSDSVFPPHHSRQDQISMLLGEWTFYQIPSTIINHQLLRVQLSKGRRETTIFLMVFCYLFSSLGYFTTPCASGTMIYIIRGEAKYGNEALMPYACSMCDSKM